MFRARNTLSLFLVFSFSLLVACGGDDKDNNAEAMKTWNGKWRSVATFLDDPAMDEVYTTIQQFGKGYTHKGVKEDFKKTYDSGPITRVEIKKNKIDYYSRDGLLESVDYALRGTEIQEGEKGSWNKFEAKTDPKKAYKHALMLPVEIPKNGFIHWHGRFGNDGFEALLKADSWPTFTETEVTAKSYAKIVLKEAEKRAKRKYSDPLKAWQGRWVSVATFLNSPEMNNAYAAVAKIRTDYSAAEVQTFVENMYSTDFTEIRFDGLGISFYNGKKVVGGGGYANDGYTALTEFPEYNLSWQTFVRTTSVSGDAYQNLLMFTPHADTEGGIVHWHIRYGKNLKQAADRNGWWPTYVHPAITAKQWADSFIDEAAEIAKMLPKK